MKKIFIVETSSNKRWEFNSGFHIVSADSSKEAQSIIESEFGKSIDVNKKVLSVKTVKGKITMEKVIVEILNDSPNYPIPYGKKYEAKGAYRQGKHIVVVGCLPAYGNPENTIRIKYPASDVKITLINKK